LPHKELRNGNFLFFLKLEASCTNRALIFLLKQKGDAVMGRTAGTFVISKRNDSKTFQITLNPSCGLPPRVCNEWKRRSFKDLPDELAHFRTPKKEKAAEAGVQALIYYLKKLQEDEGSARRVAPVDITVGAWLEKFTRIETSPRTGINASKNRPFSIDTLDGYLCYFNCHIKDDHVAQLKMTEIEEEDILEFMTRLSLKKKIVGGKLKRETDILLGGTRTFAGVVSFIKTAFKVYQKKNRRWFNPFLYMEEIGKYKGRKRDALPEEEVVKLFESGVLKTTMELAVCSVMFLSGLRRSEVFALKPCDLDWDTPKITVRSAWQRFDHVDKVLGPPKGKKERKAPFDPILQEAIRKLWKENGQHEFVFSWADGSEPGSSWISENFKRWLKRAGIVLRGRNIVPHSSRHSLASLLEKRGVPLRYIADLLGHADIETTKIYLVDSSRTIREVGCKISEAMEKKQKQDSEEKKVLEFRVS
jgi:integrase/recombinase XerD